MVNAGKGKKSNTVLNKKAAKASPVKKPTHLYLNDKFVTTIGNIVVSSSLSVLYLHNNNISKIENLDAAVNLESLYLQRNKISKIENLGCLEKLQKLYLGHNEISVVEGLENLKNLKELHIEKQRLSNGDSLCFDVRSMISIGKSLEMLNVSHNNITTISCLSPLKYLKTANISFNKLTDLGDVCDTIHNWYYLCEATFTGNPVVKQWRYRESLISYSFHLAVLDNKDISDTTRTFIKRFEQERLNHPSNQTINLADNLPDLAKSYPLPVQKAVSQAIMKHPRFDDTTLHSNVNDIYLPWNALPKSTSNIGKTHPALQKSLQKRSVTVRTLSSMFPNFS